MVWNSYNYQRLGNGNLETDLMLAGPVQGKKSVNVLVHQGVLLAMQAKRNGEDRFMLSNRVS